MVAQTHEAFIHRVRDIVLARAVGLGEAERAAMASAKLVYGVGSERGARGLCYYDAWRNGTSHALIEVAAQAEESVVQLAGTTLHELAHVLAGAGNGHNGQWVKACAQLGLRCAKAAGQHYVPAAFASDVRFAIAALPVPTDGNPVLGGRAGAGIPFVGLPGGFVSRPCPLGIGTRGGKSRGVGSGSRLVKAACQQCGYTVRVTRKWLAVGAPICPTDNVAMTEDA